jgi:hypothetical protein
MSTLPKNVERGAQFLDERVPGWRERVVPEKLNLANDCDCIIGQTFGEYGDGLQLLGLDHRAARNFGFYVSGRQQWDALTAAWRKVLAR